MSNARIIAGDCVTGMSQLEVKSVDSVITDPPYDLLTASRNGSRRINNPDTPAGRTAKGFMGKTWDATGVAFRPETWEQVLRVLKPGGYLLAFGGTRTFHRMTVAIEDAGFEIRDCLSWLYGTGFPKSLNLDDTQKGWGTALKPAWEPIVLARKPLGERNVAANVLRWGTGALNIDDCRIESEPIPINKLEEWSGFGQIKCPGYKKTINTSGRWPANVALDDEAAEVLDRQTGQLTSGDAPDGLTRNADKSRSVFSAWAGQAEKSPAIYADSGGASRFFYTSKASSSERNERTRAAGLSNIHPTIKPLDLMRWLCRLVTPGGGLVLDPFAGSGSTLVAALMEGYDAVGFEITPEYIPIIQARLDGVQVGLL